VSKTESISRAVRNAAILTPLYSGFGLMLYQSLYYIQTGVWMPVSLLDGLAFLKNDWAMDRTPAMLIGLHKIFDNLPLSGSLIVLSLIIALIILGVRVDRAERERE